MADTGDLKSLAFRRAGSSPAISTRDRLPSGRFFSLEVSEVPRKRPRAQRQQLVQAPAESGAGTARLFIIAQFSKLANSFQPAKPANMNRPVRKNGAKNAPSFTPASLPAPRPAACAARARPVRTRAGFPSDSPSPWRSCTSSPPRRCPASQAPCPPPCR